MASCYWVSQFIERIYFSRTREIENKLLPVEQKISFFPTAVSLNMGKNLNIFEYTASYWKNSSKAMAALSSDNHVIYLHVLQPNQCWKSATGEYTPLDQNYMYKGVIPLINNGYPELAKKIYYLKIAGVETFDATQVFKKMSLREIFIDDSYRYTDVGNQIVISEIAK